MTAYQGPRRAYAEVAGIQLHYRYAGAREFPALLLLHQSPSSSAMYAPLMAQLADRFFLVAPDTPGFGGSDPLESTVAGVVEIADYARVIHVDANSGAVTPTGTSWATAYPSLQEALDAFVAGDEIWVTRNGEHKPERLTDAGDPRSATFLLPPRARIYGGFAGTEDTLGQRIIAAGMSVLSGNIGDLVLTDTEEGYSTTVTGSVHPDNFNLMAGSWTDKTGNGTWRARR